MPTISTFYGITIFMNFNEHNPPHIHARYSGNIATFCIINGEILRGCLPKNATRMVKEFIELHKSELLDMWETKQFVTIPGLD